MARWFFLCTVLIAYGASAGPAYRWVDANGVVHYSDRPVEGAEVIELPDDQRTSRAAAPAQTATVPAIPTEQAPARYRRIEIASPSQQETLWNLGGTLSVQVALEPSLQPGHQLDLIYDGMAQSLASRGTTLTLTDVFRGTHTLQAVVLDGAGAVIVRSQPIQVMVQQTSIQNPNNPNSPINNARGRN